MKVYTCTRTSMILLEYSLPNFKIICFFPYFNDEVTADRSFIFPTCTSQRNTACQTPYSILHTSTGLVPVPVPSRKLCFAFVSTPDESRPKRLQELLQVYSKNNEKYTYSTLYTSTCVLVSISIILYHCYCM